MSGGPGTQNQGIPTSGIMRSEQFLHNVLYLGWVVLLQQEEFIPGERPEAVSGVAVHTFHIFSALPLERHR